MARRHKLDIFAEILRLAENGTKKTRLVYQTNSNFTIMKEYLQTLSESELIRSNDGHLYTTDKGFEFLDKYEQVMSIYNSNDNGNNQRVARVNYTRIR